MRKIRKHTRLIGKFGGKRIKTTMKKWQKIMINSPDTPVSFKEDEVTDGIADRNELLKSVKNKLEFGGELNTQEQEYVDNLKEKIDGVTNNNNNNSDSDSDPGRGADVDRGYSNEGASQNPGKDGEN